MLGLYGEADTGIPVAQRRGAEGALAAANKTAEFKTYPGAPHGFHADYRASYRREAAEDAWSGCRPGSRNTTCWADEYGIADGAQPAGRAPSYHSSGS